MFLCFLACGGDVKKVQKKEFLQCEVILGNSSSTWGNSSTLHIQMTLKFGNSIPKLVYSTPFDFWARNKV